MKISAHRRQMLSKKPLHKIFNSTHQLNNLTPAIAARNQIVHSKENATNQM